MWKNLGGSARRYAERAYKRKPDMLDVRVSVVARLYSSLGALNACDWLIRIVAPGCSRNSHLQETFRRRRRVLGMLFTIPRSGYIKLPLS